MYVTGNEEANDRMKTLSVIESGMADNTLSDTDDSIVKMVYFTPEGSEIVAPGLPNNIEKDTVQPTASGEANTTMLVVSGSFAFALVGFFSVKRFMNKKKDGDFEEGDEESDDRMVEDSLDSSSLNQTGLHTILNSSGSVTVSSSFAT